MADRDKRVRGIVHYHRKPRSFGNFSVERIFEDLRAQLRSLDISKVEAPCLSNGVLRRIWILVHAWWVQREITHITGDITFAALLLRSRSTIVTILDCIGAERRGVSGWLYRKLWFEIPARHAAAVTTISEASKCDIVKYTGCDPNKIVVTGVAIDQRFQPCPSTFSNTRPILLQIGTAPNKNIERLAIALRGVDCQLVVVGKLSDTQSNALRDNQIDLSNFERLDQEELLQQYQQCDVVVFVSTFEGFGMPILEANSIGRPVVTGNCTSMPEVAGDAACLCDPFDVVSIRSGIQRVLSDPEYRATLVNNGFKNIKRFDPAVVAKRYLEVYESLIR